MQPSSPVLSPKLRDLLPLVLGLLLLVALSSAVDLLLGIFPTNFGDIRWRYSLMTGLLTSGTQTGLFVALFMLLGALAERRLVVRVAAIAALLFGLLYLVTVPFYGLDFVVARKLIPLANRHAFDMQWAKNTGYVSLLALGLVWVGIKGFRSTPNLDTAGRKREVGEGLVVGQG